MNNYFSSELDMDRKVSEIMGDILDNPTSLIDLPSINPIFSIDYFVDETGHKIIPEKLALVAVAYEAPYIKYYDNEQEETLEIFTGTHPTMPK